MKAKQHQNFVLMVIAALAVISLFGALALYLQGPRIRAVRFELDPSTNSRLVDSKITIEFNRQIRQADYTEQVIIEPAVAFTTTTQNNSITVILSDNLSQNTEYTLSILPEVYDLSDRAMSATHIHQFKTSPARYAYIERNYGREDSDTVFATRDKDDHVYIASIDGKTETVFRHPMIAEIASNSRYLLVSTDTGERFNDLQYINLETREALNIPTDIQARISDLSVHPSAPIGVYTVTPDFQSVDEQTYQSFANRVRATNFETGESWYLTDQSGEYLRAFELDYTGSSQAILLQDPAQDFFLVSAFNDFDPVPLGSFTETFGFNDRGTSILFRSFEDIVRFDIASGETTLVNYSDPSAIVSTADRNSATFAHIQSSAFTRGSNTLLNLDGEGGNELWNDRLIDGRLGNYSLSYDALYAGLLIRPDSCTLDQVTPNTQCRESYTEILEIMTGETTRVNGFNVIWLP